MKQPFGKSIDSPILDGLCYRLVTAAGQIILTMINAKQTPAPLMGNNVAIIVTCRS